MADETKPYGGALEAPGQRTRNLRWEFWRIAIRDYPKAFSSFWKRAHPIMVRIHDAQRDAPDPAARILGELGYDEEELRGLVGPSLSRPPFHAWHELGPSISEPPASELRECIAKFADVNSIRCEWVLDELLEILAWWYENPSDRPSADGKAGLDALGPVIPMGYSGEPLVINPHEPARETVAEFHKRVDAAAREHVRTRHAAQPSGYRRPGAIEPEHVKWSVDRRFGGATDGEIASRIGRQRQRKTIKQAIRRVDRALRLPKLEE